MSITALLILQAVLPTLPFDLRSVAKPSCGADAADEIVVCAGRENEKFRLRPLPPGEYENLPPMARIGILGDGRASVETEAYPMPGGATSNRLMLRITKPF